MKRTAQKGSSPVRAGWPGLYQALGRMAVVGSKAAARPWRGAKVCIKYRKHSMKKGILQRQGNLVPCWHCCCCPAIVSYLSLGRTFSPRYGSSFWFDPLLPRIQLICLSLNCLYLFSPAYSSFRMVRTYSHPDTHIQLTQNGSYLCSFK